MKRLSLFALTLLIAMTLWLPASPAEAAVYEDFESYANFTPATDLTTDGATYDNATWAVFTTFFATMSGQVLIQPNGGGTPLTITFDENQGSYSMRYATQTVGDSFKVWGYLDGVLQFTDTFVGVVPAGFTFAEGVAYGSGDEFDQLVIDALVQAAAIDDLQTGDFVEAVDYPNNGEIMISAGAPVTAYGEPGGEQARGLDGKNIVLPADYDGNGYDTYIITSTMTLAGETWYSIWVGGRDYVWVKASQVVTLRTK